MGGVVVKRAFLLALALGGCSAGARAETIRLSFDAHLSPREVTAIIKAGEEWNAALRGTRMIVLGKGEWKVRASLATATTNASQCKAGTTNHLAREIVLNFNCMPPGALMPVLRHEFGHMLGLPHMAHTLMDPECCFDSQAIDPVSAAMARAIVPATPAVITVTK